MLSSAINNLIADLKPRQREVIVSRFGLERNNRETLASLGERYNITRERVRQIEAEALRKIKEEAEKERLDKILSHLFNHLENQGGLRREDLLIEELKSLLKDDELHFWHLKFLASIVNQPFYYLSDDEFHPFWYLEDKAVKLLKKFINHLERVVSDKKDKIISEGRHQDYIRQVAKQYRLTEPIGINYISVSKKFSTNPFGDFGLADWEEINPKTMGSKTYLVIKKYGKPLHFRNVAEEINKIKFDSKEALPQTIHNELIKDPRFVLVGRGIYGLKEHGFVPGTARDIIGYVLKREGPMNLGEIIDAIAKQRILEKNTILLNLQNKKFFKRLPDGRYAILGAKTSQPGKKKIR